LLIEEEEGEEGRRGGMSEEDGTRTNGLGCSYDGVVPLNTAWRRKSPTATTGGEGGSTFEEGEALTTGRCCCTNGSVVGGALTVAGTSNVDADRR
jgi:hypothetical protein